MGRPKAYRLKDGTRVPSVTTVINGNLGWSKEALLRWANRLGLEGEEMGETRDDLADVGKAAHAMIEAHIQTREPDLSAYGASVIDRARVPFASFKDWYFSCPFVPISIEEPLVSEEMRTGGTPDCIGEIPGGRFAVFDWKTSSSVYPEHRIQLGAYAAIAVEVKGMRIDEIHCIRVGREGQFQHAKWAFEGVLDPTVEAFRLLRGLHDIRKRVTGGEG